MLSDFQKRKLEHLFTFWDYNNNGYLDQNDYVMIATRIASERGWEKGSAEYAVVLNALMDDWNEAQQFADADNNNRITLKEWFDYCDYIIENEDAYRINSYKLLTAILRAIDVDNDGELTLDDYKTWFRIYDVDETRSEFAFQSMDTDNSNSVSINELLEAMHDFMLSSDPDDSGNYMFGKF